MHAQIAPAVHAGQELGVEQLDEHDEYERRNGGVETHGIERNSVALVWIGNVAHVTCEVALVRAEREINENKGGKHDHDDKQVDDRLNNSLSRAAAAARSALLEFHLAY